MRFLLPLLLVLSALTCLLPGCEPKEDILTTDPSARLSFSADTVLFDTVFTQVGTVTKRLWVYNRNPRAVRIERLQLAGKAGATYSLIVNGDARQSAENLEIKGNDSLQILVRAVLGPGSVNKPFLVEDALQFRTNGNDQDVKLVAYGQNAYYHVGEVLACEEVWRNDKPHVVYGYALVDSACRLTLEAGARVYFHAGAALVVRGQLLVNPNLQPDAPLKPTDARWVRFDGDRLEPAYDHIPGQWAGIQFDASSHDNRVRYAEIRNAAFGLLVNNFKARQPFPGVQVENTVFRNISGGALNFGSTVLPFGGGVLGFSGNFDLSNCLFTNCGEYALAGFQGGSYALRYCTIANYTPEFPRRETSSLTFSDELPTTSPPRRINPSIRVQNTIVWGDFEDELFFHHADRYLSAIQVDHSLLRTKEYQAAANSATKPGLANSGNKLNVDPKFRKTPYNSVPEKFDFSLDTLSPASNQAQPLPNVSFDLLHAPRDPATPDMGAYERKNP